MGERPREVWGCVQGSGPRGPRGDGSRGFRVSSCNNCTRPVLRPLGTSPQEGCGRAPAVKPRQAQFFPGHKVEDRRAPPSPGPLTRPPGSSSCRPTHTPTHCCGPARAPRPARFSNSAGGGPSCPVSHMTWQDWVRPTGGDLAWGLSQSVLSPLGGETLRSRK